MLQEFQKLVITNARHIRGMKTGDKAHDFSLPNATGKIVSLSQYLNLGPVILKFYRGEWCPICNLDLREIQKYIYKFNVFNAHVIAVSPQIPDDALTMVQKNELEFEVLSDAHQKVISDYGLQFDPGEDYHRRRDLTVLNGDGSKFLPVPATFIIDSSFTITAAHVEADYTQRMSPEEMLNALEQLKR